MFGDNFCSKQGSNRIIHIVLMQNPGCKRDPLLL